MTARLDPTGEVDWRDGRITDDAIEHMRSLIGAEAPLRAWNTSANHDAVWHFALGVGDDNPLWWDEGYAATTPWGRGFAPPTFLYSAMSGPRIPGDTAIGGVEEMLPGVFAVWAGDRWSWARPVWRDEKVQAYTSLYAVEEKTSRFGGRTVLQTDRMRFVGDSGEEVATLYRSRMRMERSASRSSDRYADYERPRYTEADLARIAAQYESESAARRGAEVRAWGGVAPGDPLGTLVKGPLTITNIVGWVLGWGSSLCQTNRIAHEYLRDHPGGRLTNDESGICDTLEGAHWDPYFARMSGMPDGYDFGGQRIAWLAHLLGDWMGDAGFLGELDVRLVRPNFLGDTSWVTGRVTGVRDAGTERLPDHRAVDCELAVRNQNGETTTTGTAVVYLPA